MSPSFSSPSQQKRSRVARTLEVCGQCATCLDFFSVQLYFARGAWHVSETRRLKWSTRNHERVLLHRPDTCQGKVRLYGSQATLDERAAQLARPFFVTEAV